MFYKSKLQDMEKNSDAFDISKEARMGKLRSTQVIKV